MFVPIYDDNPLRAIRFQYVTLALIVLNAVVFALEVTVFGTQVVVDLGITPARLMAAKLSGGAVALPGGLSQLPSWITLVSYMFFHGDIWHLGSNMLFLWVFGDNVEDALGHVRYLAFYLMCGAFAGLAHAVMLPTSGIPLVGASGAVAGVIAAYIMLYPRVLVWVIALKIIPLRISAGFAIGVWIATQIVMLFLPQSGPAMAIAWWAHIGGLIAGALLVIVLRRRGVPLFARSRIQTSA